MTAPLVLVITADPETARTTACHLALREEFRPLFAVSAVEAGETVRRRPVDIALVADEASPSLDVPETIRFLRRKGFRAPIIVTGASGVESEEVLTFQAGANDVVKRGVSFAVLHARMKAHLRQYLESLEVAVPVGDFVLEPENRTLVDGDGNKIRLTNKEARILRRLYQAGDAPVSRITLLEEIWGHHTELTTHTVETHIYRIRQKLGEKDVDTSVIKTSEDGYRLLR